MDASVLDRERDPYLSGEVCATNPIMQSLVEQAEGLGRAAVMKDVVGPALTQFLKPMYRSLSPEEARSLPKISTIRGDVSEFSKNLLEILHGRVYDMVTQAPPEIYAEIESLDKGRGDLFYYHNDNKYHEGMEANIGFPLLLAVQIHRSELREEDIVFESDRESVNANQLIEIMERESFDEILLRLTKGPNGFLNADTSVEGYFPEDHSETGFMVDNFFSFKKEDGRPLSFTSALRVEDGKVVGLSEHYHLAAQRKRQEIKSRHEKRQKHADDDTHAFGDSSGCPVRHSFEDAKTGEPQEPLIITAKKFLVAALRASQRQPEQEAA